MLTPGERHKYFPLMAKAYAAEAVRLGVDPSNRAAMDAWRHEQEWQVCHVSSSNDLSKVQGFEHMMLHYATVAGDDREIAYWSSAEERRMKYLIGKAMEKLAKLEEHPIGWEYIRGIELNMHIPLTLDDCPAELLFKIFQAIDTHVRRRRRNGAARQTHAA